MDSDITKITYKDYLPYRGVYGPRAEMPKRWLDTQWQRNVSAQERQNGSRDRTSFISYSDKTAIRAIAHFRHGTMVQDCHSTQASPLFSTVSKHFLIGHMTFSPRSAAAAIVRFDRSVHFLAIPAVYDQIYV